MMYWLVLHPHFKFKHEVILDEKVEKEIEPYNQTIYNKKTNVIIVPGGGRTRDFHRERVAS